MSRSRTGSPWWLRASLWFASTAVGTWLLTRTLPRIDRILASVSGGRLSIPRVLSELGAPVVELTTIGAKTGKERSVPVLGVREGDTWIVVASNWGRKRHPAWYHNLKANPEVKLTYRGRTARYVAREVTGDEREAYWNRAAAVNPSLDSYQRRAGDRPIPIVELTPTGAGRADPAAEGQSVQSGGSRN